MKKTSYSFVYTKKWKKQDLQCMTFIKTATILATFYMENWKNLVLVQSNTFWHILNILRRRSKGWGRYECKLLNFCTSEMGEDHVFKICCQQPTLSHCWGNCVTQPPLITACFLILTLRSPKALYGLGPLAQPNTQGFVLVSTVMP